MEILIPFGAEIKTIQTDLPSENILIAKSKNPSSDRNWTEVVGEAIHQPVGAEAISDQNLNGKQVVIITDDWGRPTPAHEVMPLVLDELRSTGVADSDITFITASAMHDPMSKEDLERKLGKEIVAKYRCIPHDAGDWDNLVLMGISPEGTPVWINRYVAEADYTIALGRIYLHTAYGYEGGYKLILPGVSGYDTIGRNHTLNLCADSDEGVHYAPGRKDADDVGKMVGIDFLINVVINSTGEPLKAFCGEPTIVHRSGIEFGDSEVWAAEIHKRADVVITSPGSGKAPESGYDTQTLFRATKAAKESGVIICVADQEMTYEPEMEESFGEVLRLHEKRNWDLSEREVQWRVKSLRGKFSKHRKMQEIQKREVILTPDPNAALENVLARTGTDIWLVALPEAKTTLPKEKLYRRSS